MGLLLDPQCDICHRRPECHWPIRGGHSSSICPTRHSPTVKLMPLPNWQMYTNNAFVESRIKSLWATYVEAKSRILIQSLAASHETTAACFRWHTKLLVRSPYPWIRSAGHASTRCKQESHTLGTVRPKISFFGVFFFYFLTPLVAG